VKFSTESLKIRVSGDVAPESVVIYIFKTIFSGTPWEYPPLEFYFHRNRLEGVF